MKTLGLLAGVLLAATNVSAAPEAVKSRLAIRAGPAPQEPAKPAQLNVLTVQGCFDDFGELESKGTPDFNSKSRCARDTCLAAGYAVAATSGGNECYCGKKYPPKNAKVDDSKCNVGCAGYDIEACGGIGFWTVYNTGLTLNVLSVGEAAKGKNGGNGTGPAVTTVTGGTVVVTESPDENSKGGANVGAIAGGVVVAVVAVAGGIAGFFFYMRRKRNREIEEEHRRNAAVNSFISGKAPSSSGMSISDSRLDPVMAQRRLSDGSIADNQDYSRKILRVTNA